MLRPSRSFRIDPTGSVLDRLQRLRAADPSLAQSCGILLAPVEREDRERGHNLVATLRAYYDSGMRVDKTADALFLHRNSVRYRLDRIRILLGFDIDRPAAIAALVVALGGSTGRREIADAS